MRMCHHTLAWLIAIAFPGQSPYAGAQTPTLVRSAQSGAWSAPTTWEGGKIPSRGIQVLVRKGHAVTYDVQSKDVIRSLHISGVLTFAPDRDTLLEVGLIKIRHGDIVDESGFDCAAHKDERAIKTRGSDAGLDAYCLCCEGKPALLVGTPQRHIAADKKAVIRLHYIDGMDRESCPAIVCCGGRMDFHGAPMSRTWVRLGANVAAPRKGQLGATTITLAEPVSGWKPGDQIIVTSSSHPNSKDRAEEGVIKSIDGTQITLEAALVQKHSGEGDHRSEVANLSRNVIVESAHPEGLRGHTMYHRRSSGSISYAEFRHLGKEGVLGRYNLHYHLCGDTMRGSSIIGASFHHSRNRWLTVHGTNYLVVRDCVGYQSVGHGFFLEDGTEVYNVFDRNLACQALAGRPLPKQILPFDPNDGAGFWFSNAHNTFTRNVAVECRQYGFRLEATPKAGLIGTDGAPKRDFTFGDGKKPFDLVMNIRQPDGTYKPQDIRTLPFIRFEDNETHSNGFWGINLGLGVHGVGPDPTTPHLIKNLKIWSVVGGIGIESPCVLMDGVTLNDVTYGVRGSIYKAQDWRNVSINSRGMTVATLDEFLKRPSKRHRQPGWQPQGTGDGGAKYQAPEIESARLNPSDQLPPITAITGFRKEGNKLLVRGTTSDNGKIATVLVNGEAARLLSGTFGEWEIALDSSAPGQIELTAHAQDQAGNVEQTRHKVTVVVR